MRVLLFTNTTKEPSSQVLGAIYAWLDERGVEHESFSSGSFEEEESARFDELRASIRDFDLVCSFGGDGTILRAAHLVGTSGVPLLGYNFGSLGFLSGAGRDELLPALEAAIDGRLARDERALLKVEVTYENGQVDSQIALNEVAVSRGHFGRIVALDVTINNSFIDTMEGDGVLVATPTGSTAYALSAGGPLIAPAYEGLCVVPISPHSLKSRAVITTATDVIRLEPNRANRQQLVLFIDGEVFWMNPPQERAASRGEVVRVEVGVCAEKLILLRFGAYDFYHHISETFFRGGNAR
ncbi:MAG: NAD(+)/NADH kinase [Coriobacteriales bacterium]|jgi:NAD+ kinase|nr:NAD(+)/NADH kinase [Coriobacteriales bacterium]